MEQLKQLKALIDSQEEQQKSGNLTDTGIAYLNGLRQAYKILNTEYVIVNCMSCGEEFYGEEPKMCCSGRECGCMGLPTEPIVCSEKCYYALRDKKN